ncbi:MAG: DUF2332 domain-containing protein [Ferrovibrio sp.]|uniref:DUF2332 domain-containing protein n=1 Tax=Ferrovibrio sp. TaxID=1917215 RepID=UPI00391B463A
MTVPAHFRQQADQCRTLGSPFTARLLDLAADRIDAGAAWASPLNHWAGDPRADALALRLAGALHRAMLDGDAELAECYAARQIDAARMDAALLRHGPLLARYLQSAPQTNDPQRSAILLGGFLQIASLTRPLPLDVCEIGASAGLNQCWFRYAYDFGAWRWGDTARAPLTLHADWHGPPPPDATSRVRYSTACDLAPIDARNPEDRQRLLSYIWADQPERQERVRRALDFAAREGICAARAGAGDFVVQALQKRQAGAAFVLCHSIVWQYIDPAEQQRIAGLMEATGNTAAPDAPLAWLRFESGAAKDGGELTLTLWPGGKTQQLAVADYHGRWVRWAAPSD